MADDHHDAAMSSPSISLLNSLAALRAAPVLLPTPISSTGYGFPLELRGRCTELTGDTLPDKLAIDGVQIEDLHWLIGYSKVLFVSQSALKDITVTDYLNVAVSIGFRVYLERGNNNLALKDYERIDFGEFIARTHESLVSRPYRSQSVRPTKENKCEEGIFVFVLDLIQDIEILAPVMLRIKESLGSSSCRILVTNRVHLSAAWISIDGWFRKHGFRYNLVSSELDASNIVEQGLMLITASESAVAGHQFNHALCALLSPAILRVTVQHGYENVGLLHHVSHRLAYPSGARFGSDVVFSWTSANRLPDLHPMDRDKCRSVGVVKRIALDSWKLRDAAIQKLETNAFRQEVDSRTGTSKKVRVLLCENMHSLRFKDSSTRDSFVRLMRELGKNSSVDLEIRSHPGKRLTEQNPEFSDLKFLTGELTASLLGKFDLIISPSSTILLDSAMCAIPTVLWKADTLGDAENYDGLTNVSSIDDLYALLADWTNRRIQLAVQSLVWAAQVTTSFDGSVAVADHLLAVVNADSVRSIDPSAPILHESK